MMNERKPHFLEVFLPSLSSNRLKIPPKFVKFLECRTTGSALLTGPSGCSWHVNLIERNGHLFFDDGWSSFVKDHSIGCGDSIVFAYNGNLDFSVLIFDQTSCEKEESFYAISSQECSHLNGNLKKRESEEEDDVGWFRKKRMKGISKPVHRDLKDGNTMDDLTCISQDVEEMEKIVQETSDRIVVLGLASVGSDESMPFRSTPSRKSELPNLEKLLSKKRKIATENKTNISKFVEEKAAQYFSSSFPYFVRLMKYSHVDGRSNMKLPVKFSMEHLPHSKIEITMRNLSGDSWLVKTLPATKKDRRFHTFSAGWSAFVCDNKIKEKDVCIFELVDTFEMRVHVLRLGLDGADVETQKSGGDACGIGSIELPLKAIDHDNIVPQKTSEMTNELITNNDSGSKNDSEMILGSQQEVSSFGHTCDDVMTGLVTTASTPVSETHGKISDQLLGCGGEVTTSYQKSGESQADSHGQLTTDRPVVAKDVAEAMHFRSSFPHFSKVIHCSNVGGSFTLDIPRKFSAAYLPSCRKEIVLRNEEGACWKVMAARYGLQMKLCGGWMTFVRQNHLQVGDICIFELVEDSMLQVYIFQASQGAQKFPRSDMVDDYSSTCVES